LKCESELKSTTAGGTWQVIAVTDNTVNSGVLIIYLYFTKSMVVIVRIEQTNKQTTRQTDKQTDKQTET